MHQTTYRQIYAASDRVAWHIDDVIGGDRRLDFSRPFLPESLARARSLTFLTDGERRTLNQIRGHEYLYMFGLVEEFILPFVLDHARSRLDGDDYRVRALLQFAGEEAKHIELFKRFRTEFLDGFGHHCDVIGPPAEISRAVLSHHPLAVALTVLHIEWMTQRHYVDSVHDDAELDPQFSSLLRHHWLEEAQHARLDVLMVEALADSCSESEIERALDEYALIGSTLDAGLMQQVEFDLDCFERATGRTLTAFEKTVFRAVQQQAVRYTFLGSGMTHPTFLEVVGRLHPSARERIEHAAVAFC